MNDSGSVKVRELDRYKMSSHVAGYQCQKKFSRSDRIEEEHSHDDDRSIMTRQKEEMNNSSDSISSQLPPGPSGLPVVGSLLEWKGPHTNLEWTRHYGPIYLVHMGSKDLVYLNTLHLTEKYLEGRTGELFLDRPMGPGAIAEGLLFGSGETWKKNKRAFMKSLHTVTLEQDMEKAIQSEVQMAIESLQKKCGKRIKIGDTFSEACANAISGMLLGGCLPKESPERKELIEVAKSLEGCDLTSMVAQISMKYPKLRHVLSKLLFTNIVDVHGTSRRLQKLLRQWIRQTRSGGLVPVSPDSGTSPSNEESEPRCPHAEQQPLGLIITENQNGADSELASSTEPKVVLTPPRNEALMENCMLNASNLVAFGFTDTSHGEEPFEEVEPSPKVTTPCTPITEHQWTFKHQMSMNMNQSSILQRILQQPEFINVTEEDDAELLQSLIDMFFGGVTSTLSGLEFVLVHLTINPDMQKMAQKEIDEVLSQNDGEITASLKDKMPYVQGCITEGLRMGCVTPSSLPHVAMEDTEIEGYQIPKGTYVMAGIYSFHHDPSYYLDPHEFRPQRHLNPQGHFSKPECYRPFGVGARKCVGDKMAYMELFLYTVYILRHFELRPVSNKSVPSLETHMRIIHRLKNFQCILERRDPAN